MYFDGFLIPFDRVPNRKKYAKLENNRVFIQEFMRLCNDALARYDIEGLPDTMSKRVILQSLLIYGSVVFFEDHENLLALAGVPSGKGFNMYGEPTSAWVFSKNGLFNTEINLAIKGANTAPVLDVSTGGVTYGNARGVLVWERLSRYPFIETTFYYAKAISDTLRTIDVARKWLKRPFIPVAEESMIPSLVKAFQDMSENEEIIPLSSGVYDIGKIDLKPVDTNPENIKSAVELLEWYENKYRELCGTDANTQMDKKGENLIQAEVDANKEYTDKSDNTIVDYLNEQFDFVNVTFGTQIRAVVSKAEETQGEQEPAGEEVTTDGE